MINVEKESAFVTLIDRRTGASVSEKRERTDNIFTRAQSTGPALAGRAERRPDLWKWWPMNTRRNAGMRDDNELKHPLVAKMKVSPLQPPKYLQKFVYAMPNVRKQRRTFDWRFSFRAGSLTPGVKGD